VEAAHLTIEPGEADGLRRQLLGLYAVHADAMHRELTACLRKGGDAAGLRARRAEMGAVAALLDQVGWDGGGSGGATIEVAGPRGVLAEAFAALFAAAAEELAADPRADLRAETELVEVSRAFWAAVLALARVLDTAARG
jgi:hypothetical protein